MEAIEINKKIDELYKIVEEIEVNEENARKTLKFIQKIAKIESGKGSEGIEIEISLLDNQLNYDGENYVSYYENLMDEKLDFALDLEGAKYLWTMQELQHLVDRMHEEL